MEAAATQRSLSEANLHFKRLSPLEATAYLVGTNVGAAVLALPYAARHAGYGGVVLACAVATVLSMVSHLYIAESMLRTPTVTQLVGLFRTYVFHGRLQALYLWFLFLVTIGVAIPSLAAYILGGSDSLAALLGLPPSSLTQLLFLLPGLAVVWLGLKTTGIMQKLAGICMGLALLLLTLMSFTHRGADLSRLAHWFDAGAVWPVLPVATFTCLSQATVPEITRGLAYQPALIPRVIRRSLLINLGFCLVVPLSIFVLVPAAQVTEVATTTWGAALGSFGLAIAGGFAFIALLTSFWGTAGTILTNIVDLLRFPSEWHPGYRALAFIITVVPSAVIVFARLWGFTALIQAAGGFGGVLLALLPIIVLRRARKLGGRTPEYTAPAWLGWPVQAAMVLFYLGSLFLAAMAR